MNNQRESAKAVGVRGDFLPPAALRQKIHEKAFQAFLTFAILFGNSA